MRPTRNKMPFPGTPVGSRTPGLLGGARTPATGIRTPATRPTPSRTPRQRQRLDSVAKVRWYLTKQMIIVWKVSVVMAFNVYLFFCIPKKHFIDQSTEILFL